MYHRVADEACDPWDISVSPERFTEQIAYLRKNRSPMSMTDLLEGLRCGNLPADAVAVTFDDGYRDNLIQARPVLIEHRVPATVFLATGFVGQSAFWWDELASFCLKSTAPLHHTQELGDAAVTLKWGSPEPEDGDPDWRGWDTPKTARQAAYAETWQKLYHSSSVVRSEWMAHLRRRYPQSSDSLASPMQAQEVKDLIVGGLVAVEAHTVTHPALTLLSQKERLEELTGSAQDCKRLTGLQSHGLAYPHGNCNAEVYGDAERAGFAWACSTEHGFVDTERINCFALPRLTVTNLSLTAFAKILEG